MRAAWRHEQLSVRMALAAAQHHSAPKCAGPEKHEAPRGQTTARAAAGAQLFCLDLDEALAAGGSRPDRLPEVRPQERVQRHTVDLIVAAPLLDVPVPLVEEQLVDASALAFLEEAEATDLAAECMELVRYGFSSSPASERMREVNQRTHVLRQKGHGRKKKKKRKKRLPRSSRPRLVSRYCLKSALAPRTAWFYSGYMFLPRSRRLLGSISALSLREGGPWLLRSILAVTCFDSFLQAQDALHLGRYGPEGHLCRVSMAALVVDSGIRMCGRCACVAQRQCYVQTVQNSVLVPQLLFIGGRLPSCRIAEADPHGPDFSAAYGVSPVAVRCQVVDALVAHGVLYMPVVAQRLLLMVQMTSCWSPFSSAELVSTADTCTVLRKLLVLFHTF